ncbi:PrsW family intramembrane metalloprotease [Micromonospora sp. LOL_015]|uniref:PrsW family intramembrane metalloprotease n=1 Tax=Micromonospora sp. LOL_015 TaxID=3345416 RepID=UPI003A8A0142
MSDTVPGGPSGSRPAAASTEPVPAADPPTAAEPAASTAEPAAPAAVPAEPADGTVPADRLRRSVWLRWLTLAGIVVLIAGCGVAILVYLGTALGPVALTVGVIAAVLPVPVLVACFLWLDRYEPEPVRYLAFCFAWGAFVSTYASLNVNTFSADLLYNLGYSEALVAVLVAPFIEELTKTLGPILLLLTRRREWSGITDGIVYCGMSAIGFAMVENILYLGGYGYAAGAEQYGPATGAQNVFAIFIVRILFTGFAHPLFTSMAGVGLGVAARSADRRIRVLAPTAGLLLAMMLHGAWNLIPTLVEATGQTLILLYGYIGLMVPIFFGMVGLAVWLRSWEGRLTERVLPDYVRAGWFTPPEVAALGSLGRRHSARRWASRVAGEPGVRAMRDFQAAATELALLRDGLLRGLESKPEELARHAKEEQRLLTALAAYRQAFVGRDPQAPHALWNGADYEITFPDGSQRQVPAPDEPVVPIPVVLTAPPPPPPPMFAGYPGWPGAGPGTPPGYGPPPFSGYGAPPPGYGAPPPPGYGAPPPPGYGPPSGYQVRPGYYNPPPPGYGPPPG